MSRLDDPAGSAFPTDTTARVGRLRYRLAAGPQTNVSA